MADMKRYRVTFSGVFSIEIDEENAMLAKDNGYVMLTDSLDTMFDGSFQAPDPDSGGLEVYDVTEV